MTSPTNPHGVPFLGKRPRVLDLPQGLLPNAPWPSDIAASSASVHGMEIRAASVRGFAHRDSHPKRSCPRQDAYGLRMSGKTIALVVCDGVGSYDLSHLAAQEVCETLPDMLLAGQTWDEALPAINTRLQQLNASLTSGQDEEARREDPQDSLSTVPPPINAATTIGACLLQPTESGFEVNYALVGDIELWTLSDGIWAPIQDAAHSESDGLHSTRTKAFPTTVPKYVMGKTVVQVGAFFMFSDGVAIPLTMSQDVQNTLARWWEGPPDPFTFASQTGFARVSFFDDRTAVGVWIDSF